MNNVAESNGRLISVVFVVFLNNSDVIIESAITLRNHQILLRKKASVGLLSIYPIHVNTCQLIIEPRLPIIHELAISFA